MGKPTLSITGVTILTAGLGFSSTLSEKECSSGAGKGSVLLGGVRAGCTEWKKRKKETPRHKKEDLFMKKIIYHGTREAACVNKIA